MHNPKLVTLDPPRSISSHPIVAVGASAGGLSALRRLFASIPMGVDAAFVVIQHFPKNERSALSQILSKEARLPVVEISPGSRVLPGTIHVKPPGSLISLKGGYFEFVPEEDEDTTLPIDYFLKSLAAEHKDFAVAVILSGHGSDGLAGAEAIKANEGHVLAQLPDSAEFPSMPNAVISAGLSDGTDHPDGLWALIEERLGQAGIRPQPVAEVLKEIDITYSEFNKLLGEIYGFDFTPYKTGSIARRLYRRMAPLNIKDAQSYGDYLKGHPEEVAALYRDLFIRVSSFFRDPQVFGFLKDVIRAKLDSLEKGDTFKVWSIGCANGEEPYSLAILLKELTDACGFEGDVEIVATDINDEPLAKARNAAYTAKDLKNVPQEQLESNFHPFSEGSSEDTYRLNENVQRYVRYKQHDIINEPVVGESFDLIACRNLLIYLEPKTQSAVLSKIKEALSPSGHLVLGASEFIGVSETGFRLISTKLKIFEKLPDTAVAGHANIPSLWSPFAGIPASGQTTSAPEPEDVDTHEGAIVQDRIEFLEQELSATRDSLEITIEEIRASNEELLAMNEEFQVSNQELQSVSEELHAANDELNSKNDELQQYNLNQSKLINSIDTAIIMLDAELKIKQYNLEAKSILSLPEDCLGMSVDALACDLEDPAEFLDQVNEAASSGGSLDSYHHDSEGKVYYVKITPLAPAGEESVDLLATFTNLTENIYTRGLLQAMRATGLVCWEYDVKKREIDMYHEGTCVLGYELPRHYKSPDAVWLERVHEEDISKLKDSVDRCLDKSASECIAEFRMREKGGDWMWMRLTGRAVRVDATGAVSEMSGILKCIQDQKTMELDLVNTAAKAQAAAKAKTEFLSVMSHEIRTPLNGVVGMAEVLKDEMGENSTVDEYIRIINESATILLELINGILQFSKAESLTLELDPVECDLSHLVETAVQIMATKAEKKKIRLEFEMDLRHRRFILDPARLRQIIFNLIDNAIKYTEKNGQILLSVQEKPDGKLSIRVKDSGIGMSESTMQKAFDPFTQADSSTSRSYEGVGLGLSIVRQLAILMGGDITVTSELDVGSEFTLLIPVKSLADSKITESGDVALGAKDGAGGHASKRALIVDDNSLNAMVMSKLLAREGIVADTALSGAACLELIAKFDYDIVFMDLHLPESSGFEISKEIVRKSSVPIVAFTADCSKESAKLASSFGMHGPLVKPVSVACLNVMLSEVLGASCAR